MKYNINLFEKIGILKCIMLLLFTLVITSCQRESENQVITTGDEMSINFTVKEILDQDVQVSKNASLTSNTETNSIDANGYIFESFADNKRSISNISNKKEKVASTMQTTFLYRLLIYEVTNEGDVFVSNDVVTVGEEPFIKKLSKGVNYKYIAYSYDNRTAPASPTDVNNPIISTITNGAFLYASGGFKVGENGLHVPITFRHKTSKVEIELDARTIFASSIVNTGVSDPTVFLLNSNITNSNVDLKNGNLIGGTNQTTTTITVWRFASVNNNNAVLRSTNQFYTTTPLTNMELYIGNLSVVVNGTTKVLAGSNSGVQLNITGFTGQIGTHIYRGTVRIFEGGEFGSNVWAKGNLYYDASAPEGQRYKFDIPRTVGSQQPCNYYWNYNTLLPRSVTGDQVYGTGDPCAQVYPHGTWRTPSKSDYENLYANSNQSEIGDGAVKFENKSNNKISVSFHEAGWMSDADCSVSNTNDGQYWTSTSKDGDQAYSWETRASSIQIEGEDKTKGLAVRCIRNK